MHGLQHIFVNGFAFVVMVALGMFAKVTPEQFDAVAQQVATILIAILALLTQFGLTAKLHQVVSGAGIPVIGRSYTRQALKK